MSDETPTRVVLAEDSVLLRDGIVRLLTSAGFEVAAACPDGETFLAAVEEHRDITQALLAGSGEQARSLVVAHLQNAADYLISLMASIDLDPSNFNTERGSSNREAVALDHMIPGLPAQRPEGRTP